jgi:hypothetical protein
MPGAGINVWYIVESPLSSIVYLLRNLGTSLLPYGGARMASCLGALLAATYAVVLLRTMRGRQPPTAPELYALSLIAFSALFSVSLLATRLAVGTNQPDASRYITCQIPGLFGVLLYVRHASARSRRGRIALIVCLSLVSVSYGAGAVWVGLRAHDIGHYHQRLLEAVVNDELTTEDYERFFTARPTIDAGIRLLREEATGPFARTVAR